MTVSTEDNKTTYAGDAATASFSTGFTFAENGEITVTLVTDSTGAETEWTYGTEYTLTGANTGNNGTLTVDTSPTDYTPASGTTLVIELDPDFFQLTALPRGGTVSPKDTLEPMHDKRVRQMLKLKDLVDRSLKISLAETSIGAIPQLASRLGKYLRFNASTGDPETVDLTYTVTALSDATPASPTAAGTAGSGADISRGDHAHPRPTSAELSLEIGVDTQAYDADTLKAGVDDTLTAGFAGTDDPEGTFTSGTYTPVFTGGNFKTIVHGAGGFAIGVSAETSTIITVLVNASASGSVTTSGYDSVTGDTIDNTGTNRWMLFSTRTGGMNHLHVVKDGANA